MSDQNTVWRKDVDFRKRNQHYVPQFWQREFKDACGHLYVRYSLGADPRSERDSKRGTAFEESTKNIFTDDYTYTVMDASFRPTDALEDALAAEEGRLKQAHDQILSASDSITSELRGMFCRSIALTACRHPHVMRRFHHRQQDLALAYAEIHRLDRSTFDANLRTFGIVVTDDEYEQLKASPEEGLIRTAVGLTELTPNDPSFPEQDALAGVKLCAQSLSLMEITILESPGSPFFIIGDTPIRDSGLATGFIVPLSKTAAVKFSPSQGGHSFSRRTASASEVGAINQEQYNNSVTHVIGPDPTYLDSLSSEPTS